MVQHANEAWNEVKSDKGKESNVNKITTIRSYNIK
jgi:hypothetical protein